VTNTHVVTLDGATSSATLRVTTADGSVYDAEVVGLDPTYDLAVIKLKDAENLPTIAFASSSNLNVGDITMAVGAPLGLSNTVTTGIVSALNRSIQIASSAAPEGGDSEEPAPEDNGDEGPFQFDFGQGDRAPQTNETISIAVVQTDAAINPGNSGGALVDGSGALIGINTAIASVSGGSSGLGFAIPIDTVREIAEQLISTGQAVHASLGVNARTVTDGARDGALVVNVEPGSPAAAAGIQEQDVVIAVDGEAVGSSEELAVAVDAHAPGDSVTVEVVRGGGSREVQALLEAA